MANGYMVQSDAVNAFMNVDRLRLIMEKTDPGREVTRSAQYGMLQDVSDSCGIGGNGPENDAEGVFLVLIGDMKMTGPGFVVHQLYQS